MPSLKRSHGYLFLINRRLSRKAHQIVGRRDPGARLVRSVPGADPLQRPVHHDVHSANLFGEQNHVAVIEHGIGQPPGANPRLEIASHREARQRCVDLQIAWEVVSAVRLHIGVASAGDPELPEREMTAGVGDIEPLAHLGHAWILDGRPVESFDIRAEHGLIAHAFKVVPVAAGRESEIALVVRVRLGGAVQQQDLVLLLVVIGGGVEDREILPWVLRMGRQDWIALVSLEFHHHLEPGLAMQTCAIEGQCKPEKPGTASILQCLRMTVL